jgi:hypothetical protein
VARTAIDTTPISRKRRPRRRWRREYRNYAVPMRSRRC